MKFLSRSGLAYYHAKIKALITTISNKLGSTNISSIGDGTVTGAISSLNTNKAGTSVATTSANGLMSSSDKSKLNNVASNANNYSHPTSGVSSGTYGTNSATALTPGFGATFSVPGMAVDANGHITSANSHTVKIPSLSFSQSLTSGTALGTLTINGTAYTLYAVSNTDYQSSSGNSTSKLFLVGTTSQSSSGARTYSNSGVYMQNGTLVTKKMEFIPSSSATLYSVSKAAYILCEAEDTGSRSSLTIAAPSNLYDNNSTTYYELLLKFAPCMGMIYSPKAQLGSSSKPFHGMYSSSYVTVTSDQNRKKSISKVEDERYLALFDAIDVCQFQLLTENAGPTSPTPSRYHLGVIAQEVEEKIKEVGLDSGTFSAVKAESFLNSISDSNICGGWQINKEGYDYSENTYFFKHGLEYEFFNEIIEKPISEFFFDSYREDIQYLMIEDNSKLTKNQPPVVINSISLIGKDGELTEIPLTGETISYYESDDTDFENPLSKGELDDEGHFICTFDKMYSAVFLKIATDSICLKDYESVIIDVDYVSEYKMNFIPKGEYVNANVWDRDRNDKILYNYSFAYDEWYNIGMYALQETRKEVEVLKEEVEQLKTLIKKEV